MSSDARALLKKYGLRAKKSWGQNFLVDERAYRAIVDACALGDGDWVVEIGAGLGTLTARLAETAAHVVAVERDRDMLDVLRAELGDDPRIEIVEANALTFDYAAVAARAGRPPVGRRQPAVSDRVADPVPPARGARARSRASWSCCRRRWPIASSRRRANKAYGALSVMVRMYGEPKLVVPRARGRLRAGAAGRLGGAAHRAVSRRRDARAGRRRERFAQVVHAAFGQRRKTLRNALSRGVRRRARSIARSAATGIDGQRRGETLSVEEFARARRERAECRCLSCPRSRRWCARCGRASSASASRASRPAACRCGGRSIASALERACVGARVEACAASASICSSICRREHVLLGHLGMTGRLAVRRRGRAARAAHPRACSRSRRARAALRRSAPLRRACASTPPPTLRRSPELAVLGPDPLEPAFTVDYLRERSPRRSATSRRSCSISRASPGSATSTCARRCSAPASRPTQRSDASSEARARAARRHRARARATASPTAAPASATTSTPTAQPAGTSTRCAVYGREGQPCRRCGAAIRRLVQARPFHVLSARAAKVVRAIDRYRRASCVD